SLLELRANRAVKVRRIEQPILLAGEHESTCRTTASDTPCVQFRGKGRDNRHIGSPCFRLRGNVPTAPRVLSDAQNSAVVILPAQAKNLSDTKSGVRSDRADGGLWLCENGNDSLRMTEFIRLRLLAFPSFRHASVLGWIHAGDLTCLQGFLEHARQTRLDSR